MARQAISAHLGILLRRQRQRPLGHALLVERLGAHAARRAPCQRPRASPCAPPGSRSPPRRRAAAPPRPAAARATSPGLRRPRRRRAQPRSAPRARPRTRSSRAPPTRRVIVGREELVGRVHGMMGRSSGGRHLECEQRRTQNQLTHLPRRVAACDELWGGAIVTTPRARARARTSSSA